MAVMGLGGVVPALLQSAKTHKHTHTRVLNVWVHQVEVTLMESIARWSLSGRKWDLCVICLQILSLDKISDKDDKKK